MCVACHAHWSAIESQQDPDDVALSLALRAAGEDPEPVLIQGDGVGVGVAAPMGRAVHDQLVDPKRPDVRSGGARLPGRRNELWNPRRHQL